MRHQSIYHCPIAILEERFERALVAFYQLDKLRLPVDLAERAILFRLGLHLHGNFEDYDVFAEYNRNIFQPKRLSNNRLFIPDLVIMKPGDSPDSNLLAIEAKKVGHISSNLITLDRNKLEALTTPADNQGYHYKLGCQLFLGTNEFHAVWYHNGCAVSATRMQGLDSKEQLSFSLDSSCYGVLEKFTTFKELKGLKWRLSSPQSVSI